MIQETVGCVLTVADDLQGGSLSCPLWVDGAEAYGRGGRGGCLLYTSDAADE